MRGEREAGHKHHDPPQLARIPGQIGTEFSFRQERQNGQRDDREPGHRLDVAFLEPVDEAVQFGSQGQDEEHHRSHRYRQAGAAEPGDRAQGKRNHRGDRAGRVAPLRQFGRVRHKQDRRSRDKGCRCDQRSTRGGHDTRDAPRHR